jgi:uncharacterized protein YjbI with pentapeptide repeats
MNWLILAIIALGAGSSAAWLWWWFPKWQIGRLSRTIRDAKARADLEDNFRKTIGQFLGGAAVLLGAGLAYVQFTEQQQASRERLVSDQIAKGFEQLSSNDKPTLKLGGIYELGWVMNNSEQYHEPILQALSGFARDSTKVAKKGDPPATEIQAALTVIADRDPIKAVHVDLHRALIPQAILIKANLVGAILSNVDLNGADLSEAKLTCANLADADLHGATMFLTDLTGANLTHTTLSATDLSKVVGLKLALHLNTAKLTSTTLTGADLGAADLVGANLSQANLSGADLHEANLSNADLSGLTTLSGANLSGASERRQP